MRQVLLVIRRLVVAAMMMLMTAMYAAPGALAQHVETTTSAKDLQALAESIEDEGKRKELLATIRALIAAREGRAAEAREPLSERIVTYASEAVRAPDEATGDLSSYFKDWPLVAEWVRRQINDPDARVRGLNNAAAFVSIFAAGWLAEYLLWRLLAGTRGQIDQIAKRSGPARIPPIIIRALLHLLPLLAFAAVAYGTALLVQPTASVRTVGVHFVNAYLVGRVLMAGGRLLLSPAAPPLRLLPLRDVTARDLFVWIRRFVAIGVSGYFVIAAMVLLGLPRRGAQALVTALGAVLVVIGIVFVLRHRRAVAGWMRKESGAISSRFGAAPLLQAIAAVWHVLAIGYLVAFFMIAAFGIQGGFRYMLRGTLLSLAIVAAAWLVLVCGRWLLDRLLPPVVTEDIEVSPIQSRVTAYRPVAGTVVRAIVVGLAGITMLQAWGIDTLDWFEKPSGRRTLGAAVSIALVLAMAVLVWEVASNAVERYLTTQHREGVDLHRGARIRTLLPLLRKALFIFLSLMVILISLSEIGVDIAPLLAGAGVIGLAIGFGSQKLVQDVITGVFMLVEDALSVGDVVTVAGTSGVVEDMSIRSIRLRDLSGNVHAIPFSSVGTVTNMTKDFSYYLMDIGVDYQEDTDRVVQVCTELLDDMRKESAFAFDILEPLDVLGVDQFAESAVIIKARIKTRPVRQWVVGREFNRRMKKRFDELGIVIPFPHRTVYVGIDKNESSPPFRVRVEGGALPVQSGESDRPSSALPGSRRARRARRAPKPQPTQTDLSDPTGE